jgi:hypothetical protein
MSPKIKILLAETEQEKQAIYRFRYGIHVEEIGKYRDIADHKNRLLIEPCDAHSRIFYALENDEMVATGRLIWGAEAPLSQEAIADYRLAPFLAELPLSAIAIGDRAMVVPRLRGTDLYLNLLGAGISFANKNRIQLIFTDCEPHLLNLYLGIGYRTYSTTNISSDGGYLIPIVFLCEDIAYLKEIRSPLLPYMQDFGDDARVPLIAKQIIAKGSAVMNYRLSSPAAYWNEVHGAISKIKQTQLSVFDGLTEEEIKRCLDKSNIIECQLGDHVLNKGIKANNLFIVLSGTLELRDHDVPISVVGPGDIFGETSFLLERPRARDVYAVSDKVKVLSLSEVVLKKMIESDSTIAAKLLLNIAKLLCFRILTMR